MNKHWVELCTFMDPSKYLVLIPSLSCMNFPTIQKQGNNQEEMDEWEGL